MKAGALPICVQYLDHSSEVSISEERGLLFGPSELQLSPLLLVYRWPQSYSQNPQR